jgi:hypothetical protein
MPCVIGDRFDSLAADEQARILRETRWADNFTNAEWPVVLRHDGVKPYIRSKLKKKAVGWVMALSRMVLLNRSFAAQVLREADALYRQQIEDEPPVPWALLADLIEQGWQKDGLAEWLRPLGNLRGYNPGDLEAASKALVAAERTGWLPMDGNPEDAGQP